MRKYLTRAHAAEAVKATVAFAQLMLLVRILAVVLAPIAPELFLLLLIGVLSQRFSIERA